MNKGSPKSGLDSLLKHYPSRKYLKKSKLKTNIKVHMVNFGFWDI